VDKRITSRVYALKELSELVGQDIVKRVGRGRSVHYALL